MPYVQKNVGKASFERLIRSFTNYAQASVDVRAAVVLGSRARVNIPADEWSDLDVAVVTTDPKKYLETTEWLKSMGKVWLTFVEKTGTGDQKERRVLFEGGFDVDFAIIPEKLVLHFMKAGFPPQVVEMFGRGTHILLDKDRLFVKFALPTLDRLAQKPPTQAEFSEVINDFLYHAVWTAKKLRRGELWTAKACSDSYMKWLLLRMIEWHAKATLGWKHDTWHDGRFMERWADPRARKDLRDSFAYYEKDDIRRALFKTMDLFRWLALETANKLRLDYPGETDERITELVETYLSGEAT